MPVYERGNEKAHNSAQLSSSSAYRPHQLPLRKSRAAVNIQKNWQPKPQKRKSSGKDQIEAYMCRLFWEKKIIAQQLSTKGYLEATVRENKVLLEE